MAIPGAGFDDGDDGIFHHVRDQAGAAARDDDIDQAARGDEFLHRLARARIEQLNRARRHAGYGSKNFRQRLIAVRGLFAAAKHDRVAGFEAEHGGVNGDVGARFVHNANHAQRHADFANEQAIGARPLGKDFVHWIRKRGDCAHRICRFADAPRIQQQAIEHGASQLRLRDVLFVGAQDFA